MVIGYRLLVIETDYQPLKERKQNNRRAERMVIGYRLLVIETDYQPLKERKQNNRRAEINGYGLWVMGY